MERLGTHALLFTDRAFFILLTVTFCAYYLRKSARWQIAVLILASVFFYAYSQPYLLILLGISACIATVTSYRVENANTAAAQRVWAVAGVALNLLILAFFKYGRLAASLFAAPAPGGATAQLLMLPLPIGISFYTFHGISLVVDVFRARSRHDVVTPLGPGRGFLSHSSRTLLYLTFFPQLVAGPIVKARDFYPQMTPKHLASVAWYGAAKALVTGFFLKSVIADNLAQQTFVLQPPYCYGYSTLNLVVVLFGYSAQIFADFAGYSLIAIGLARLFGYELPQNFRFPYIAQTFSDFWTRWHMSLSAWLRDYVYYPLGGNRRGRGRTYLNLLLVMALGGLWHGAAWSYAVWGVWHGAALAIERMFRDCRFYASRLWPVAFLRWAVVFGVVTLGWILFLLPDFSDVAELARSLVANRHMPFTVGAAVLIALYCAPVACYHCLYLLRGRSSWFNRLWTGGVEAGLQGLMLCTVVLQAGNPVPFIYFQF